MVARRITDETRRDAGRDEDAPDGGRIYFFGEGALDDGAAVSVAGEDALGAGGGGWHGRVLDEGWAELSLRERRPESPRRAPGELRVAAR